PGSDDGVAREGGLHTQPVIPAQAGIRPSRSGWATAKALRALAALVHLQAAEPVEQAARGLLELQRQGTLGGVHAGDPALDRIIRAVRLAFGHRDLDAGVLLQLADIVLDLHAADRPVDGVVALGADVDAQHRHAEALVVALLVAGRHGLLGRDDAARP